MGSMLKFDSDRRELVRERRDARLERKQQRRQARERKRSQTVGVPFAQSATQVLAERELRATVDRIVVDALDRHERITPPATPQIESTHLPDAPEPARTTAAAPGASTPLANTPEAEPARRTALAPAGGGERAPRLSRRERDLAAFRDRRRRTLEDTRDEARARIARAGELASVADALAALAHAEAAPWSTEYRQLEVALDSGRIVDVGATARRALWAISRDATRSSRRARRDPDLALAACVAYAIIARLPRTALRSAQRERPVARTRSDPRRAFWR